MYYVYHFILRLQIYNLYCSRFYKGNLYCSRFYKGNPNSPDNEHNDKMKAQIAILVSERIRNYFRLILTPRTVRNVIELSWLTEVGATSRDSKMVLNLEIF